MYSHAEKPGRFILRPHLFLKPGEPLECPAGHRVHTNASVMSHDTFICQQRVGRSHPSAECGMRVFVVRWPDGRKYLAQVTPKEALFMRDQNMSPDAAFAYLSSTPFPQES